MYNLSWPLSYQIIDFDMVLDDNKAVQLDILDKLEGVWS